MSTCEDCLHYVVCKAVIGIPNRVGKNSVRVVKKDCPYNSFKDKSEWIHLPCKIGDKIFMIVEDIESGTAFVDEGKVISVTYGHIGVWIYARYKRGVSYHHKVGCGDCFFTREEAEKALEDRRKEDEGK